MKIVHHSLVQASPGARHELVSLHFGTPGAGPKALIQASLHADEIPAMLVAHHLRGLLAALEDGGRLQGEIVLVPAANPIGLGQRLLQSPQGRFEFGSGENFNRHYADLTEAVAQRIEGRLGAAPQANVALVRAALRECAASLPAGSALQSLRKTLLTLAVDADVVLDLHCDNEGLMHLYTATPVWPRVAPLARALGARAALLATESGDHPFDEACSMPWPRLAERFGAALPIPPACVAVTVELRGETDVSHELAARDAQALVDYLATQGFVSGPHPLLPPALCEPTPLSGCMPVVAPHGGVLAWLRQPGDVLKAGDAIADLVDPITGQVSRLASPVDGLFFARELRRFALAGASVGKVAGREALRQGKLLSE